MPRQMMWSCDVGNQFRGHPVMHDARFTLLHATHLAPGDNAEALCEPLDPSLWQHVEQGFEFNVHEGRALRGRAVVLVRMRELLQ